jgi:cellulose synthase/poly-beta-1,6-N-acetylglucosamine synthase-like glycosyltransferase
MLTFAWICAISTTLFALVPFVMTLKFRGYVRRESRRERAHGFLPRTALIVPCKGTDLHFADNIHGFLSFAYPNYEVIFVTATIEDPARGEIERIIARHPQRSHARLIVAGVEGGRGQKMTNMLRAVESVADDVAVFAFMDADIKTHAEMLGDLIEPLSRQDVGATSGFPVFVPQPGCRGSYLKSVWSMGGLLIMADTKRNFSHAAAMCMRRDVFASSGIEARLKTTLSDSMAVTHTLRALGLRIHFVPSALAVSEDRSSIPDVVRWTNRMTVFTRVYNRPFWWTVALSYCFINLMIASGFGLLLATLLGAEAQLVGPAVFLISSMALQIVQAFVTFPSMLSLLAPYPEAQTEMRRLRLLLPLVAPAGAFLVMLNSMMSLTTNVVTWRGIRYRLVSPSETEVIGGA